MALVTALSAASGHSRPVALQRRVQRTAPAQRTGGDAAQLSGRPPHAAPGTRGVRALSTLGTPAPKASRGAKAGTAGAGTSAGAAGPHPTGATFSQPAPGSAGAPGPRILEAAASWSPPTGSDLLAASSDSAPSTGGSAGSADSATRTPTGTYPGHGSIEAPTTSAAFAALGGGVVSARAMWTGTPNLELEISCGGSVAATRTGSSGLSLEVDDARGLGSCTVTLSLPPGVQADVPFTLIVEPAP